MGNTITVGEAYDPFFYAAEALRQLNKKLGLAFFVFRGFDKTPADKGSRIKLRRPGKFAAQSMPIALGSASDIEPEYMNLNLDNWEGTMFALTDKELSYTRMQIVNEHITPLAFGVADKIDQTLVALLDGVGERHQHVSATPVEDFPDIRLAMFDNNVPETGRRFVVGGNLQNAYEKESVFYQADTGIDAAILQRDGVLGAKFGFNPIFTNSNITSHTGGTMAASVNALAAGIEPKGETTIVLDVDSGTLTGTIKKGDLLIVNSVKYPVTADVAAGGNAATIVIAAPGLQAATADGDVVTFEQETSTERGCAFHQDAFALAMSPLSSLGDGAGARIATVTDPVTGITLRSTIFYDPATAKNYVRIDALWGVLVQNPWLAVNVDFD